VALEITDEFNQPYSERTSGLPSSFSPSVVGIAGVPYLLNTSDGGGYKREAFEVVQQRNTGDTRDTLLLPQDVWRQQVQSWNQGAGQSNADRNDALPFRYEESFGVDPWYQWHLSLLPETKTMGTYSGDIWLTTYDVYLAVVNDQYIHWYNDVSASASIGSTSVGSVPVVDVAESAPYVTTLTSDGAVQTTAGSAASPVLVGIWPNANFIAYVKDYMILGQENKLYDITGGSPGVLVFTHPVAAFRWKAATSGNSCIYLIGNVSDRTVVHRVGIKQDGTGLSPAIVAATLPDGEVGYSISEYLGFIFIGTDKGIRVAQEANTSGDLVLGPIIPTTAPVECFEGQDRFVWYGLSEMDSTYGPSEEELFPTGTVCGLGRMDLSVTTVNALTPAYASDICALGVTGATVQAVVTFQGKRVFAIGDNGVFAEGTELMEGGWLRQGVMSFSVEDLKTGLYVQAKWLPLKGEIDLDASYDSTGFVRLVDYIQQGTIRSGNTSLDGTQFSRFAVRYVLKRSSTVATEGPDLTRWEVRAKPVRGKASRWTLPVMNYEEIELDGVTYTRDPLAVLNTLVSLVEDGTLFVLQESGQSFQVTGKDFVWQPEKLSINGKSWEGICMLVVEEVQ
jgi:hypothetical protein